jgi:hypothetical protein
LSSGFKAKLAIGRLTDKGLQIHKRLTWISVDLKASGSEEVGLRLFDDGEREGGVADGLLVVLQIGHRQTSKVVEIEEVVFTFLYRQLQLCR